MKKQFFIILIFIFFFCSFKIVFADDTGWKYPTSSGAHYNDFTNPSNAYVSDSSYAAAVLSGTNKKQSYEGFNFDIPAGSTINGIQEMNEGYASASLFAWIYLYNATNSAWAPTFARPTWTTGNASYVYPDPPPDDHQYWGTSWQVSDFSNANFSVYILTDDVSQTYYLNSIAVKVYYTLPEATPTPTPTPTPALVLPSISDEGGTCTIGMVCYYDWLIMNGFILFFLSLICFYPVIRGLFSHKKF